MTFGSASKYNSRQPTNKSGQIVGASFPNSTSGTKVKKNESKQNQKPSSIAPSEEFRVFWGNNVEPSWFEGKRPISPFIIFISLLVILNIYLCSNLLFTPGELKEVFVASETDYEASNIDQRISGMQTIDDEKMLLDNMKKDKSKKDSSSKKASSSNKKSSTNKKQNSTKADSKRTSNKNKKNSEQRSSSNKDKSSSNSSTSDD